MTERKRESCWWGWNRKTPTFVLLKRRRGKSGDWKDGNHLPRWTKWYFGLNTSTCSTDRACSCKCAKCFKTVVRRTCWDLHHVWATAARRSHVQIQKVGSWADITLLRNALHTSYWLISNFSKSSLSYLLFNKHTSCHPLICKRLKMNTLTSQWESGYSQTRKKMHMGSAVYIQISFYILFQQSPIRSPCVHTMAINIRGGERRNACVI